jgi:hypothetical protein
MSRGLLFWVIYIVCLILWLCGSFLGSPYLHYAGGGVIEFILIGLLGWQVYGPPVHA